jgi:plasmid stabilization system protein ParE
MKVFWTKEALDRLNEIELYVALDNPNMACKFIDSLISVAEKLSKNPERGRVVPEFSIKVIRELLSKNYRIVYLIKKNRIEILTIFEGHQLLKKEEIEKGAKIN